MSDDGLNMVVLLVCLAILLPFGVNAIVPLSKEIAYESSQTVGDKTVQAVEGIAVADTYDGTMDLFEVVLTTQVQDYCMPFPRLLTVPNATCPSEKYHYYTSAECINFPDAPSGAGCFTGTGYRCTDTTIIDIDSMYRPDVMAYGSIVFKNLQDRYYSDRYVIDYSYGRKGEQKGVAVESKESYRIHKVN